MSGARLLVAALALAATPGCASIVTATQNATPNVSGELWYVKQQAFFGLVFSSRVFHCTPPGLGSAKCKEASIASGPALTDLASATVAVAPAPSKPADDASTPPKDATTDKDKKAKDKDKKK